MINKAKEVKIKMKKVFALMLILLPAASFSQKIEQEVNFSETGRAGINAKIDYFSSYIYRGQYYFNGDAAFVPSANIRLWSSNFFIGIMGEFTQEYIGDRKKTDDNFAKQTADSGINYIKRLGRKVTINANIWYWWFFNSKKELGYDMSYASANVTLQFLQSIPFNPFISYTHEYRVDKKSCKNQSNSMDFYVKAGMEYNYSISAQTVLELGVSMAFWNYESKGKMGISDIKSYLGLSFATGITKFTGSLNYYIIPSNAFGAKSDSNRFSIQVGAGTSF